MKISKKEAKEVLNEVDALLLKVDKVAQEAGDCFIDLSFLLLKVKRGAYWTERGFASEHEYIEKSFPQSRAQYYKLIRCGISLQGYKREDLKRWGIFKCEDLTRLHVHFEGEVPGEWFNHLDNDNKDTFRRRVRAFLDNKEKKAIESGEQPKPETEDNFITIRIFGNDINIFNTAIEKLKVALGSDKSIGYLIVMALNDWLAGFNEDGTGRVSGKNAFILASIEGLVKQLDLKEPDVSQRLIGIVAQGVENNVAT